MADDWKPVSSGDDWQPVVNPSAQSPAAQAMGLAKQGGAGLIQGAAAIPGYVPTALLGIGSEISKLTGLPEAQGIPYGLTPEAQLNAALPQPQSGAESAARNVGAALPSALAASGRLGANIAGAVGSGLGATVGGELAPGFGWDPATAQTVGALAGGVAGLRSGENASNVVGRRSVASSEDILNAARESYDQVREAGHNLPIPQGSFSAFADSLMGYLKRTGPTPDNARGAYNEIESLKSPTFQNRPDLADLVRVRQNLHSYLRSKTDADAQNRAVAAMALPEIDNAIKSISPPAFKQLGEADANYSAGVTAQTLSARVGKAESGNEAANSGLNKGNKILQNIDQLINQHTDSRGQIHGLNPQDVAVLNAVKKPDLLQQVNRYVSGILGGGGGLGALAAHLGGEVGLGAGGALASSKLGGPDVDPVTAGIVAPAVGLLSRMNYNRSVARNARNAEAMIRARSPYAQALGQGGPAPLLSGPQLAGRAGLLALPTLPNLFEANQSGQ